MVVLGVALLDLTCLCRQLCACCLAPAAFAVCGLTSALPPPRCDWTDDCDMDCKRAIEAFSWLEW